MLHPELIGGEIVLRIASLGLAFLFGLLLWRDLSFKRDVMNREAVKREKGPFPNIGPTGLEPLPPEEDKQMKAKYQVSASIIDTIEHNFRLNTMAFVGSLIFAIVDFVLSLYGH